MKKDITELYCFIEDLCRIADEKISGKLLSSGKNPTRIPKIIGFSYNSPNAIRYVLMAIAGQ